MNIAILGDSHAANFYPVSVNDDRSWVQILSQKYDLTSFAQGGSSLFYAYNKFIDCKNDVDKIILFVTTPGRLYIDHDFYPNVDKKHLHISSYDMAKNYADAYKEKFELNKLYESIANYYLYVKNDIADKLFHNLMLEKIKQTRPDTIIVNLQEFSFQNDTDFKFYNTKSPLDVHKNYWDLRHCHLSREKHIILAELLDSVIENNVSSYSTRSSIDCSKLLNVKPSKSFEEYFLSNSYSSPELISFEEHIEKITKI